VTSAATALASAMSLRYAAFDFLIRDGAPVFLEVNPDGDWRWAERKTPPSAVTLAVAGMLSELHWTARRGGDPGAGPFDLLRFLRAGTGPPPGRGASTDTV